MRGRHGQIIMGAEPVRRPYGRGLGTAGAGPLWIRGIDPCNLVRRCALAALGLGADIKGGFA